MISHNYDNAKTMEEMSKKVSNPYPRKNIENVSTIFILCIKCIICLWKASKKIYIFEVK